MQLVTLYGYNRVTPDYLPTTAWLTGSQKAKERRAMLALIESGEARLVVGTHAVIQEKVKFHNLALAIIDEQHRFGVAAFGPAQQIAA